MEKRRLGKTGLDVSVLGFGCAPAAFLKSDQQATARMIGQLLDRGINLVDTAMMYPGSQEFIGQHLSHRRDDFVLVSKCGQKVPGVDAPAWSAQAIAVAVDRALASMRTDRIDVMLIHSCDLDTLRKGEVVDALVAARDAGKIAHVGYSGDDAAAAYAATLPDVAVIEASVNIADQRNVDVVLPVAEEHDVGVIVKRPIANAAWKDLSTQQGLYKTYAATYTDRLSKMAITPADLGFDGDPADVWPAIALRFTLGQPGVTTAIVGTTRLENAEKNLAYAAQGPLPTHVVARLRSAFQKADPDGKWVGQT
jgi:aryl-alcohol dehydrogenase-like predicted oxidoreductase